MSLIDPSKAPLIVRPRVRLHTLRPYTRETFRTRPQLPVVVMYSDITRDTAVADRYVDRLNETRLEAGIFQFAQINDRLFERSMDRQLHALLRATFVKGEYHAGIDRLGGILARDGEAPDELFIFHRLGALFNITMLLGRAEITAVAENLEITLIGDLALLANDVVKRDLPGDDYLSTIVLFLPEWELDNPSDVGNAIGRFDLMLQKHLNGDDPFVVARRQALGIDPSEIDRVPVTSHAKIVFGIFAAVGAAVQDSGSCTFDPATLSAAPLSIPPDDVANFIASRALTRREFRARLSGDNGWADDELHAILSSYRRSTDVTLLRCYPFLILEEHRVLVLDLGFVIDLLSSSIYYAYFNTFRDPFAELWGRVFELYAVDLLEFFYPCAISVHIRPPTLLHKFKHLVGTNAGEIDAIVDRGRTMLVCEMKASRLDLKAKLSRNRGIVAQEIRRKFIENQAGDPKALKQLARNTHAVLRGWVPGVDVPEVAYPVLISEERSFESFEMNAYLNELFTEYVNEETSARTRPLTTMSIDELEQVLPVVADETVSWEELLESRFDGSRVRALSVHQALYNLHLTRQVPLRPNTFLRDRFGALFPDFGSEGEA